MIIMAEQQAQEGGSEGASVEARKIRSIPNAITQTITGTKVVVAVGKKKTAIAKAVVKSGAGRVRINGVPVEIWPIEMARLKMMEPMILAGKLASSVDIDISVRGGGFMGQASAVRIAISRGLLEYFQDQNLYNLFSVYDESMIKGDHRRTEPKKPGLKHARSKRQKAYR